MKEAFIERRFLPRTIEVIEQINDILDEYEVQGFTLSLRQLFYQYVARGLMPNTHKTYTYLGATLRDADWDDIEDRTRETIRWPSWKDPSALIRAAAAQYAEDPWVDHSIRLFVWIEKAALANIIEAACRDWHVPYFAVRGYNSLSEMYCSGKEFEGLIYDHDIRPIVLYLGDHDPSGINMPRNVHEMLMLFAGNEVEVRRLALNLDQVREHDLPPNYAKETDKRFEAYVREFGTRECWELDALEPTVIDQLLRREIEAFVDKKKWRAAKAQEKKNRAVLGEIVTGLNRKRRTP